MACVGGVAGGVVVEAAPRYQLPRIVVCDAGVVRGYQVDADTVQGHIEFGHGWVSDSVIGEEKCG